MYYKAILKPIGVKSNLSLCCRLFSTERPSLRELAKRSLVHNEKDGYVMKSPYGSVPVPELTLDQYIFKDMAKWQNHTAIECGITGRKFTYAKFRDHSAALAIRLRKQLKLEKNDIVGVCLPNVPEYIVAFTGAIEGGLVVTTVNPWYTSEEISRQLISCQAKAIFCLIDNYDVVKKACALAKQPDIKVIAIRPDVRAPLPYDAINFTELINPEGLNLSESSEFNKTASMDDFVLLPYSSGTTGLPKGVMLTHTNLVSNSETQGAKLPFERLVIPTTADYQDVMPGFLPFYHIYGLMVLLLPKLALGAKIVSMPKFNIDEFLRISKEHKATFLHLVPPVVIQLGNYEGAKPEHFEHVRLCMSAASNLAQADAERLKKIAKKAEFIQGYGLSETSPISSITPQGIQNYATIGWPAPNIEMKIADLNDPHLKGLPTNGTGEICVRGPNVMKGYFKNEQQTREMITEDKWLRTGDVGHFDEDGLFYISDRNKELIKVNAHQVAPAELEGILREHPDVLESAVVGIPHPTCGEVPKAFVIRRPDSNVSEKDLQDFVAKQVIRYKRIDGGVMFIDSIPKTQTGKILRREIRKTYCS